MNINEIISNKFEFDTADFKCWYFEGQTKVEIDQRFKSDGEFNYQVVWQLDPEHKDYWINYTLTFSQNKKWINFWYKKKIADSSEEGGYRHLHYKKKLETNDQKVIIVEFDYRDEMVKVWDPEKNKHRFVNRVKWESDPKNQV